MTEGEVKLLTIGIPTFNRDEFLRETLSCVIRRLPEASLAQVEILISDNGSRDQTRSICEGYIAHFPHLVRYVRHERNLGYDRNLDSIFSSSNAKYVLLLGDDDLPAPGAFEDIWRFLVTRSQSDVGVVFSYHRVIDSRTGEKLTLKEDFFQRPSEIQGDEFTFDSGIELIRMIRAPLNAGLTGTIFLRSAWLKAEREHFFDTNFLQLAVAYQVACRLPVHMFYRQLFVVRMNGEHQWPVNGKLYFGLLKAGLPLFWLYPKDIVSLLRRRNDWAVRKAIIIYRGAAPDDRQLSRAIESSLDKDRVAYWLFDFPMLMAPTCLLRLLLKVRAIFQRSGLKST